MALQCLLCERKWLANADHALNDAAKVQQNDRQEHLYVCIAMVRDSVPVRV